jgi:PEP-CTERM motif
MRRLLTVMAMLLLAGAGGAEAESIVASATGSATPTPAPAPGSIVNGDFTISQSGIIDGNSVVGDGINEDTTWTLNFNPGYASFDTAVPLASALLTLTLTPGEAFVSSDTFAILGLPSINSSAVQDSKVGMTQTVHIQLLETYTSAQILDDLKSLSGRLNFEYQDDAVISFASLELQTVPEPSSLALCGIAGFVGLVYSRARRKRSA